MVHVSPPSFLNEILGKKFWFDIINEVNNELIWKLGNKEDVKLLVKSLQRVNGVYNIIFLRKALLSFRHHCPRCFHDVENNFSEIIWFCFQCRWHCFFDDWRHFGKLIIWNLRRSFDAIYKFRILRPSSHFPGLSDLHWPLPPRNTRIDHLCNMNAAQ